MADTLNIGIIGDYDSRPSQLKTVESLNHVLSLFSFSLDSQWISTLRLHETDNLTSLLQQYHGIWCGPGDYARPEGAMRAIRFLRENDIPFLGT